MSPAKARGPRRPARTAGATFTPAAEPPQRPDRRHPWLI